eukprot:scaffold3.g6326.t1
MLEHDPSARHPASRYLVHYQQLAKEGLEAALGRLDALRAAAGEAPVATLLKAADLELLVADCQLARDKLGSAIRQAQARQAANEIRRDDY